METFGERLRRLRITRGLTTYELGALMDVSQSLISWWESGRRTPKPGNAIRLAAALQVSRLYLETGEHEDMNALRVPPVPAEREFFHERLRRLREDRGWMRLELAARVDATERQIRGWETGEEPGAREISNLARALGVTTDYLLNGREAPHLAALHRAIQIGIPRERLLMMCRGEDV